MSLGDWVLWTFGLLTRSEAGKAGALANESFGPDLPLPRVGETITAG